MSALHVFARAAADLLWPPRSLLSHARTDAPGVIEAELWRALDFLSGPLCRRCGIPLPEATSPESECLACLAAPPRYRWARAALAYDDLSRPLVLDLKHGGRTDGVAAFAAWIADAAPFAAQADWITPVPLHWRRLVQRGYNQAGLLAKAVARRVARPFAPDMLARTRATPSQGGLSASGRARNVQGAFAVRALWKDRLAGKTVLLIDDVFTTGSTVQACARALRRAGAAQVDVAALARVVRPAHAPI
jgi:ComF family protein